MASFNEFANKSIRLIFLYLKNISINFSRRLIIGWKHLGIFWQKCRIGKQFRHFGETVYAKLAAGDVNPLLQDEVRDQIASLESLQENIVGRRGAIEQIREQIKTTSYRLTPVPPAPSETEATDAPVD